MDELYKNGDQVPIALAKKCERRRCGHIPDPVSGRDCITACVNISGENKHRYILATQDEVLRGEMRMIPGIPMVYIKRAVMIMEPPSPATLDRKEFLEQQKLGGKESMKRKREDGEESAKKVRKKGPKEPNPLSVKKKKSAPTSNKPRIENSSGDENETNVIGDITDSHRRHKSTRRGRRRKKNTTGENQEIPEKSDT
jgi:U3 small nucleolar RNA-associated protein 23